MKHNLSLLLILFFVIGCIPKENLFEEDNVKKSTIFFQYQSATKSLNISDQLIDNCNILIYDSKGNLTFNNYSSKGPIYSIKASIKNGEKYSIYFIANIGDLSGNQVILKENNLKEYKYKILNYSEIANINGAVPMGFSRQEIELQDNTELIISLTRCISLITISVDKSQLYENDTFDIISAKLKNVPASIKIFGHSKTEFPVDVLDTGDYADENDLIALNEGKRIGYYMFENMQGDLLPQNTISSNKVFPENSIYNNLCTYFEIEAKYTNPTHYGTAIYRFYLGKNHTSNFDIERNNCYEITIIPTPSGISEESWRVDISDLGEYVNTIIIENAKENLILGETHQLRATVLPETAKEKTILWQSSDTTVATITPTSGIITPISYGEFNAIAYAIDGSGISAYVPIKVTDRLSKIFFTESSKRVGYEDKFSVTLCGLYGADTVVLDNSLCSFTYTYQNYCTHLGNGLFQANMYDKNQVTTRITATYNNLKATCSVTIRADLIRSRPHPYTPTISVGDTLHMQRAMYYKNGYVHISDINGTDLTPGISGSGIWLSEDTSIVSCSQSGEVVGLKSGTTTIEGRYYYSDGKYESWQTTITVK